ncbi:pyridoxal phosphate-dependent aminotransferase [Sphingobacterium sp. DR205]|uniref:pyridoxal phosphate-dependent aminotransferase n=1 Tax=Sphingobacterium sp. DR205 TaxID=2713573 RepID=UPI0013E46776|nr:pyridoxal phosphate-dependent aminotransferase [Sphingobacterium sp. DR205]QIH33422.1 pyridoxal phosphate-dependent aminotransferase [Sphingobacterium sp. DR205]
MILSSLLEHFNESETLKMAKLGHELRGKGIDIIDLGLGKPNFDTPEHIKEAAITAINDNWSHYSPVPGFLDLREAVCVKLKRDNALDYRPEEIVISTGSKQSLANAIMVIVDAGDEVIIPTPYFTSYPELVKMAKGTAVKIQSSVENGFKITPAELEQAITPKTKAFLFSSPCNPSGAVYNQRELANLAEVFKRYPNIVIISDEIYEYINYGGKHQSFAQFKELRDRVIIVNGLSKSFAMTGWRIGYTATEQYTSKAMEKIQGLFTSGTCSIAQRAAIIALTEGLSSTFAMTEEFAYRKKRTLELVKDIPGVKCSEPDGAFYVFPDMSYYYGKSDGQNIINNADDLCMYILKKAHVLSIMGDAFGEPNCIRFSFANSLPRIEKGWRRIKIALEQLA